MNNLPMNNHLLNNHLIGVGYESTRKESFWWLTIYKSHSEDFENIMHFINDYFEESKAEHHQSLR